jgi:drug/metabolite transporter (DMT)-like permease
VNAAETGLLIAVAAVPLLLGAVLGYLRRPWWWGAIVAVVVALAAAILPEPEAGESRLASGDLLFVLALALVVTMLAWLGAALGRRIPRRTVGR